MQSDMTFDRHKPLESDLALLDKLGLKPFDAPHGQKTFVGEVSDPELGYIKIWVSCWPACFWEFEIHSKETGKITKFETGSGSLDDYYSIAEKIMEGMVVVTFI